MELEEISECVPKASLSCSFDNKCYLEMRNAWTIKNVL